MITWAEQRFLARNGWILLLHGLLSLFALLSLLKRRERLATSARWRFLSVRPLAASLFFGYMATALFYEYQGAPASLKLLNLIVACVFFARLSSILLQASWKRHFVYGLVTFLITSRTMDALSFSMPVLRLYTVVAAFLSLIFCLHLATKSSRQQADSRIYPWALRAASLFFGVVMVAEFWGRTALALHLFVSLLDSGATTLVFILFMYMIRGIVERLFELSPLKQAAQRQNRDPDPFIRHVTRLIDVAIWTLVVLPAILMIWGLYDTLEEATKEFLAVGFTIGSQRITVGMGFAAVGILYGSSLVSWALQTLLVDDALVRQRMQSGARHSVARLVHYGIAVVAFLWALSAMGFEISKLTMVLSALGVGIGFGLRGVANNFVSGIILLFERPVRVGDSIEVGGRWAEIKHIGLRATTVRTFDEADVIIPNADLVTQQVTNWTLSDRKVRLTIPVGVAYGSDVALVMATLQACGKAHPRVLSTISPQVLFLSFGDSSLDFELRVWVKDADFRLVVKSDLHQAIDQKFREANITIAFPQRDLHLHAADDSAPAAQPEARP